PRCTRGERDTGEGFVDLTRDQALSQTVKGSSSPRPSPPLCGREGEVSLGFIALCLNSIAVHPGPRPVRRGEGDFFARLETSPGGELGGCGQSFSLAPSDGEG